MKYYLKDHNISSMKKEALDELNSHLEKFDRCIEKMKIHMDHLPSVRIFRIMINLLWI